MYKCLATLIDDGNPDITSVTGTQLDGRSTSDVLFFQNKNYDVSLKKIPSNFGSYFPSLTAIYFVVELETITASDLQPFPNLVFLNLQGNRLRRVDGDLFKYNPKLYTIYLSANSIEYVGEGIFDGLNELFAIYFAYNPCTGGPQGPDIRNYIAPDFTLAEFQAYIQSLCGTPPTTTAKPTKPQCKRTK